MTAPSFHENGCSRHHLVPSPHEASFGVKRARDLVLLEPEFVFVALCLCYASDGPDEALANAPVFFAAFRGSRKHRSAGGRMAKPTARDCPCGGCLGNFSCFLTLVLLSGESPQYLFFFFPGVAFVLSLFFLFEAKSSS